MSINLVFEFQVVTSTGKKTKGKRGNKKTTKKSKVNKTPAKKNPTNTWGSCEVSQRIFTTMEKYKEVRFWLANKLRIRIILSYLYTDVLLDISQNLKQRT